MNKNIKVNGRHSFVIYLFTLFTSSFISILLLFDDKAIEGYDLLWLLPFAFFIMSLFSFEIVKKFKTNFILFLIWGGYFLRFIITPMALMIGNYRTIYFQTVSPAQVEKAIILMVYEIFIVFTLVLFYMKYSNSKYLKNRRYIKGLTTNKINKKFNYIMILLTFFCALIYIYIPELRSSFTWIFAESTEISNIRYDFYELENITSFNRSLASLFIYLFNIIRYLIPVSLLQYIYVKFKKTKFTFILSLIVCMLPFLVINESNIQPVLGMLINIFMMTRLYPEKKNTIITFFVLFGGILLLSIIIGKLVLLENWQNTSGGESLSLTLDAYIPGVGNVAAAFNINEANKLKTLFYDFINIVPFKNSLFPGITSNIVSLTHLFNSHNGTIGGIIPHISGAEYYLGFALAPLLPAITSIYSLIIKEKAELSTDYWYYFFYMFYSIRIAIIPFLYNHISLMPILFNAIVPMYFIIEITKE